MSIAHLIARIALCSLDFSFFSPPLSTFLAVTSSAPLFFSRATTGGHSHYAGTLYPRPSASRWFFLLDRELLRSTIVTLQIRPNYIRCLSFGPSHVLSRWVSNLVLSDQPSLKPSRPPPTE